MALCVKLLPTPKEVFLWSGSRDTLICCYNSKALGTGATCMRHTALPRSQFGWVGAGVALYLYYLYKVWSFALFSGQWWVSGQDYL